MDRLARLRRRVSRGRPTLAEACQVVGLSAFAVAQPVLDIVGANATFLVAHRAGPARVVVLVAVLLLVPPAALLTARSVAGFLSPVAGAVSQALVVGLLAALAVVPPVVRVAGAGAAVAVVAAAVVATAGAVAYARFEVVRRYLALSVAAPVLFAGLFLLGTPVRGIVLPAEQALPAGGGAPTPVVVLVLDELSLPTLLTPDLAVDADTFPGFARLADTSTLFLNASTVSHATGHAVPSLLTGRLPRRGGIPPAVSHYPDNLFTLAGGARRLVVQETTTALCPPGLCERPGEVAARRGDLFADVAVVYLHLVLPPDVAAARLPPLADRWAGFARDDDVLGDEPAGWAADPAGTVRELFATFDAADEPTLWFGHVMLPHVPWRLLPSGQAYQGMGYATPGWSPGSETWADDEHLTDLAVQRYLLQTMFTDVLVGEMLDALDEAGILDEALVVVTADHGLAFEPGLPRRDHHPETAPHIHSVPLFVKAPGQTAGRVDERNAELVDVVPTIADVLGVELGWEVAGASLLGPDPGREVKRFGAGGSTILTSTVEGLAEASARLRRPFGGSFASPYAWGPHGALLGVVAPSAGEGDPLADPLRVVLDRRYDDVDPAGRFVPARVTGTLTGGEELAGLHLAVAVNGRVAGMTVTHVRADGTMRFGAMVDPAGFVAGRNRVDVHLVAEDGRLLPLPTVEAES